MFSLGYLTTATKKEARDLVLMLMEKGLIACANIIPTIESYFIWEDHIEKGSECLVFLKTIEKNEKKIIKLIKKHHSYDMPSITFIGLDNGEPEFMNWVAENCS